MVTTENYSKKHGGAADTRHLPPARLMDTAWQGERAPIRGSNGLRFHSMTCWRRPHQRTRGEVEAAWGSEIGYCGVMSCSLERGGWHLRPCQEVQKCTLKNKNQFYDVYVYLTQKPMPNAHKKKSLNLVRSEVSPLSLGLCRWNCPLNCRTAWGAGHPKGGRGEEREAGTWAPSCRAKAPPLHEVRALMGWKGLVGSQGGSHSSPYAPELSAQSTAFEEGTSPKLAG